MITFPHAKINLGLRILKKRTDGYHEIATCFYAVPVCDVLEIVPADHTSFTSSGLPIPGSPEHNLCLKALNLLKTDFDIPDVLMHLHKAIPMGAGLGGGSSDGAFTLKMVNELFSLGLTTGQLLNYASRLGSDCPFFIEGKPVLATGTGTELHSISLSLSDSWVRIIYPGIHVGTAEAYAGVKPDATREPLENILGKQQLWKNQLVNDFEPTVTNNHPVISKLINDLYANDAWYAAMSGSGSAVFGLFRSQPPVMELPPDCLIRDGKLD